MLQRFSTIRFKLIFSFLLIAFLSGVIGFFTINSTQDISNQLNAENLEISDSKQRILIVQKNIARIKLVSIGLTVGAVIFILITGLLISYWISRKITNFANIVQKLSLGNLGENLDVDSNDELGKLQDALNTIIDRLSQTYKYLGSKLRVKNLELEVRLEELERVNKSLSTSKKSMQDVLRQVEESNALLSIEKAKDDAILNNIGEGLIVADTNLRVIVLNRAGELMLGMKREEAVGKLVYEVYGLCDESGNIIEAKNRPLYKVLQTKQIVATSDFFMMRKDGVSFPILSTNSPILINEKIAGVISVFKDFSKEKQVDRMKTEFISLASHQLRTPLSGISWFTDMLIHGDAGAVNNEQLEFLQNIKKSTDRMVELVGFLLNISRIESGHITIELEPTDVKKMIEDVTADIQVSIKQKGQSLIINTDSKLPLVNLDQKLIRQVLMNFLTNSIKYTPKGGEINLTAYGQNNQLIVKVSDTGYGIPKAEQSKIFQKFYRGVNIVKIETHGTGLGLYLVKLIIEATGGKTGFESEENKGTTFWFSLPMTGMKSGEKEVALDTPSN